MSSLPNEVPSSSRTSQLRCAAEDVVTAAQDGAENEELRKLAAELVESAKGLERLR